jgi:RNA polymerase sigma factor (sigma-70 family)
MTREDYGAAYQKGYGITVRFLVSKGSARDAAEEIAQAAWVRGWERIEQLRDASMVFPWLNTIALNILRTDCRRQPFLQILSDVPIAPSPSLVGIDLRKILKSVKPNDRVILQRFYVEGFKVREIAEQQGCTETALKIRLLRVRRSIGEHFERRTSHASGRSALGAAESREASV